jgi:hypothetical protein
LRKTTGIPALGYGTVSDHQSESFLRFITDVEFAYAQAGREKNGITEESVVWLSGHKMPSTPEQREYAAKLLGVTTSAIEQMYIRN